MSRPKCLCVIGTRPEAIKMAPVVFALRRAGWVDLQVVSTGQHHELLPQVLASVGLTADRDLGVGRTGQSLGDLTARILTELAPILRAEQPDLVLVQGDTSSAFAGCLACFYAGIPTGHIEAGLRTQDLSQPFPEELHRQAIAKMAHWHFAPTPRARTALLQEGVGAERIFVTGNTIIDMLRHILPEEGSEDVPVRGGPRLILFTLHRRENVRGDMRRAFRAVRVLAERNPDVRVIFPVHKNPLIRQAAARELGEHPRITWCEPMGYPPFIALLRQCYLVISDSGGIQEEAAALGKPVVVLREKTERVEAVRAGVSRLTGTAEAEILRRAQRWLDSAEEYRRAARACRAFGDGHAAERINRILQRHFEGATRRPSGGTP